MRRAPLATVALALMAGIAGQHWLSAAPTWVWMAMAAAAALTGGLLLILCKKTPSRPLLALALLCVTGIGGAIGRHSDPRYNPHDWVATTRINSTNGGNPTSPRNDTTSLSRTSGKVWLEVCLTETPQPREHNWRARAAVKSIEGKAAEGDIRAYFRKDSLATTLRYGDRLLIHGKADTTRRTIYTTSDHYIVTARDSSSPRAHSERLRMRLLHRMQQGPIGESEGGVAEAMTLGWRADIAPATQSHYRDAGISHLLAVSGLHVGLVAALAGALCFWIPKHRRGKAVRAAVMLTAVWTFCVTSGMSPSTTRAALMFSLLIVSTIGERGTPSINILAAAAIITLMANPMLLMDTGWQMSYAAVAGILLARPLIALHRNWVWQAATVSLIATLSTLPVTISTFHTMQPYFLIANVLIVPLAGVVLALSLAYMAVPAAATAWPLEQILHAMEWLTAQVSELPGAVIEVADLSAWFIASLAATVTAILLGIHYLVGEQED